MNGAQVHFEVFIRRRVNAPWSLQLATEARARALEAAEALLASGEAAAVQVNKETLDPESREFRRVTVLSKGAVESTVKRKAAPPDETPLCVTPQDLYTVHARERIGRLLDGWLRRRSATAFELLHRPDLVEALDASGAELQHALQKVSIPEAQARGVSTHAMIRTFQGLVDRAVARVLKDGREGAFPTFAEIGGPSDPASGFEAAATRLAEGDADPAYLLGGGVAAYLASASSWSDKVGRLLDLADRAPGAGRPRALALAVLEQPLSEIVGSRGGLADLLGADLDLGGSLAALIRLAASDAVDRLIAHDPALARSLPALTGQAARLADWLDREAFDTLRQGLTRRVLRELVGPRRLRPADPDGEIAILRALAMALTAASGKLLPPEDVQAAFIERSKTLVAGDFVETYLVGRDSPLAEAEALVRLAENVAGSVNKRAAGRWLVACVTALRFEKALRGAPETPAHRLGALAALQRAAQRAGLAEPDAETVVAVLGEVGGRIEADARLIALIVRADAPLVHRLGLLLRLASGEAAPRGPAADRAKSEALKLLRTPEMRTELAAAPDALARVRGLMAEAGLAA